MSHSDLIRTFLTERLGIEPERIQPAALLSDLGVDSLMLAELMFEAEDHLGRDIPSDLPLPRTVGEMEAVLDALAQPSNG